MRTPEILDRLTIRLPEEIFLSVKEFAKKKKMPYAVAARELIRRGLVSFDRNHMNGLESVKEMYIKLSELSMAFDEFRENQDELLSESGQNLLLRDAVLIILSDIHWAARTHLRKQYPVEDFKRQEFVDKQVAALMDLARGGAGK